MKSCAGNKRSEDAESISARTSIAVRRTLAPTVRAVAAGTGSAKTTQTCSPSPDLDHSSTAGIECSRQTSSTYARASSAHDPPSKSQADTRPLITRQQRVGTDRGPTAEVRSDHFISQGQVLETLSDLRLCGAPPGIRTQNLRIRRRPRTVQRVAPRSALNGLSRTFVQPVVARISQ